MAISTAQKIRFGAFELDRQTGELWKHGTKLKLQGQPIAVLALLLERPGELVTREEIRKHLWPEDTFVDFEHSLNTHIKKLRQVFDDDAETPRYIETLPRRGYRFIAKVEAVANGGTAKQSAKNVTGSVAAERQGLKPDGSFDSLRHDRGRALIRSGQGPKISASEGEPFQNIAGEQLAQHSGGPSRITETSHEHAPLQQLLRWKYAVAVLVVCALLVGLLYRLAGPNIAQLLRLRQFQQLTVVPLTALPGNVTSPTFSPDGSQIAFAWDGENNGAGYDLYVKAIGTEKPLRLTHHPALQLSAAWSPDGRSIAISRISDEEHTGIYLLPPTGGPERKLLASRENASAWGNAISWSADGKYLAHLEQPENAKSNISVWLYLLKLDSLERTAVKTDCDTVFTPSFSPRGDYLAWVCRDQAIFSVNAQRLSDGRTRRLSQIEDDIDGMAWSGDGGRILFSSSSGNLWETSLARPGDAQKLPFGYDAQDIAVSPSAHRLVYAQGVSNVNIWRLDLLASPPKADKLIVSSRDQRGPSISPDGSKIAFGSDRTGHDEVWVCDADGSNPIQLSSFGIQLTGTPRWSPDGKWIAFDSRAGGEANIYLVDPQGGVPRKVEIDIRGNSVPSWSHDGKWIYFVNGDDVSNESVWKVPSSGGHAVQLARNPAVYPMESPDGQYVYFYRNRHVWRVNTDGSGEQAVKGMPESGYVGERWFPFGSGIYFMSNTGGKDAIEFFDVSTQKVSRVYELEKPAPGYIGAMPVSSDGKWMLFPQVDELSSNLMMIENWR